MLFVSIYYPLRQKHTETALLGSSLVKPPSMRALGVLQSQLLAAGITITTYAFSEWRKKLVVSAVPIVFPLLSLPSAVPLSTRHLLSMTFPWHSYSGGRNLLLNLATMIKSHTRDFAEHSAVTERPPK